MSEGPEGCTARCDTDPNCKGKIQIQIKYLRWERVDKVDRVAVKVALT